ncbi:MAG: hypothetical protein ACR2MA_11555 [Egibacteraceae bacterium]
MEASGELRLRLILPGERVLYSVRPRGPLNEGSEEEFFVVALAEGAQPELLSSAGAYQSWTVGPAVAAERQLVHASCHLRCTLWSGLANPPEGATARYDNDTAIEGLTSTPDGRLLGFVEFDIEGALTATPRIRPVDFSGVLRWIDPSRAARPDPAG